MKRVTQTRLHDPTATYGTGNCFAACIASVFEVEISDLPDEMERLREYDGDHNCDAAKEWAWAQHWTDMSDWAKERGFGLLHLLGNEGSGQLHAGICLIGGAGPRGFSHSVVGRGRRIIWDVHPTRDGLLDEDGTQERRRDYTSFVALEPSLCQLST
jgi:hypothetical protein